jgi:hypothetical protein
MWTCWNVPGEFVKHRCQSSPCHWRAFGNSESLLASQEPWRAHNEMIMRVGGK